MADDQGQQEQSPDLFQPMVTSALPGATSEQVAPALAPALPGLLKQPLGPGGTRVLKPKEAKEEEEKPAPAAPAVNLASYGYGPGTEEPETDAAASLAGGGTTPRASTAAWSGADTGTSYRPAALGASYSGPLQDVIRRGSEEEGIDPAYAMATAERESRFNPGEGGTGTIRGMYQMSRGLRYAHGIGESTDPYVQTRGFGEFTNKMRAEMKGVLGRDPTWEETYAGHHFGGTRAARIINGQIDPRTPVSAVFSSLELQGNPHIVRAGTVGNLMSQTTSDMSRRMARYGGKAPEPPDFSEFGDEPESSGRSDQLNPKDRAAVDAMYPKTPASIPWNETLDLSTFGQEAAP